MTQAEYQETDSYKLWKWKHNNEDEANILVGRKCFNSLLENLPQLAQLHSSFEEYIPGWADSEGGTGEGYLQFTLTFFKDKENYPEVKMPDTTGWSECDLETLKAILIKQELKKNMRY